MIWQSPTVEEVLKETKNGTYSHKPGRDLKGLKYYYYLIERPLHISKDELQARCVVELGDQSENVNVRELQTDPPLCLIETSKDPKKLGFKVVTEPMDADTAIKRIREFEGQMDDDNDEQKNEIKFLITSVSKKIVEIIARDPHALEKLEWRDLERSLHQVFSGLGFDAELTPGSKDGGKDIIVSCSISKDSKKYFVEIKHWRSGQKVGYTAIKHFYEILVSEDCDGGLFLSTYGFKNKVFSELSVIETNIVKLGTKKKIVSLCRRYLMAEKGIYAPPSNIEDLLYEDTITSNNIY
ncbi:restriction endonuclease [bacterium]|nr:restriction endonuclease [bacterium]